MELVCKISDLNSPISTCAARLAFYSDSAKSLLFNLRPWKEIVSEMRNTSCVKSLKTVGSKNASDVLLLIDFLQNGTSPTEKKEACILSDDALQPKAL